MNEPKVIREFIGKNEYEFRIYETTFMVYRISKKARWWLVWEGRYDYKGNEEILKKAIDGFIAKVLAKDMIKEERKKEWMERRKEMKRKAIDELNVWDLLHGSRWYDMTHNDFLQVCDKKWSKVFCRYVHSVITSWDAGYTGEEEPIKDSFCDEGEWYVVSPYGWIKLSECRRARKSEWNRSFYFNYVD